MHDARNVLPVVGERVCYRASVDWKSVKMGVDGPACDRLAWEGLGPMFLGLPVATELQAQLEDS